jgi:hypothetical protein
MPSDNLPTNLPPNLPINPNNLSITGLARFFDQEASNNVDVWKPTKFINYAKIVDSLSQFLHKTAKSKLTNERYCRIIIKVDVSRENGAIIIDISERQNRISGREDKRLAKRRGTQIIIWVKRT